MQGLMKFHPLFLKILRKQNVTDGRTHGRMDGQRENSIPAHKHSLRGYNKQNCPLIVSKILIELTYSGGFCMHVYMYSVYYSGVWFEGDLGRNFALYWSQGEVRVFLKKTFFY